MYRMFSDGGNELARLFRLVRAAGATTSLDLALPDPASPAGQADWPAILNKVLPLTDLFVPSLEELLFMLDRAYFDALKNKAGDEDICAYYDFNRLPALADRLLAAGVRILAIKLGRYGFYVRTACEPALKHMGPAAPADTENWANREIWSEILDVPRERIASTSGAGDASIAGFIAGLARNCPIETACALACAVAALKIQYKTSVGGIQPLEEVLAMLPKWPREKIPLAMQGWLRDEKTQLWHSHRDRLS